MSFNASKCKVLTVTRKLNPVNFDYHLEDKTLAPVRKEKDLGVVITSNFTWDQQILTVVSKANKMLGLLRRTCPLIKDTRVRRSLYLSLVKCHLNYATEVWSPSISQTQSQKRPKKSNKMDITATQGTAGVQGSTSCIRSSTTMLW